MNVEENGLRELIEETATKLGHKSVQLYPPGQARDAYLKATVAALREIGDRLFREPPDVMDKALAGRDAAVQQVLQRVFAPPLQPRAPQVVGESSRDEP